MTHAQAATTAAVGVLLTVAGLSWALGPWALVGSGAFLVVVALLLPVRERRAEPVDEPVPPLTG